VAVKKDESWNMTKYARCTVVSSCCAWLWWDIRQSSMPAPTARHQTETQTCQGEAAGSLRRERSAL